MILLLAGTAEARLLAGHLAVRGVPVLASLAGAVRAPQALPVPTRIGGFGGAEGFLAALTEHGIRAVIDATHPFADRITARTAALCADRGIPLLRLERLGWAAGPGDRWTWVDNAATAAATLGPDDRAFLATGRQSLTVFRESPATLFLRVIDAPEGPFPGQGTWVMGRPPFTVESETALFRHHAITRLVSKDSGGAESAPKLVAARNLGLPVVMIRRPAAPAGLTVTADVGRALAWAEAQCPSV